MANDCSNILEIKGSKREFEEFLDLLIPNHSEDEDFSDEGCGYRPPRESLTFEKVLPLSELMDVKTNASKELFYWGTNRDIYPETQEVSMYQASSYRSVTYYFQTSWNPPSHLIDYLSIRFPELKFNLKYYEPFNQVIGEIEYKGGELLKSKEYVYDLDGEEMLQFIEDYFDENIRNY